MNDMDEVHENTAQGRFELPIEGSGGFVAASYYRKRGVVLIFTHTEVPDRFSGQGIASQLAKGIFEQLRESGRKAILHCPFLKAYFARHPEVGDVVISDPAGDGS